jgi:hypothetical protein
MQGMLARLGSFGDSIYIVLMNDLSRDQTQLSGGSMRYVLGSAGRWMDASKWVVEREGFSTQRRFIFFFFFHPGRLSVGLLVVFYTVIFFGSCLSLSPLVCRWQALSIASLPLLLARYS